MENEKYCQRCGEPVIDKIPGCPLQCMSPNCKAYIPPPKIDPCATPVIWIFGGPRSGKTSQCAALASKYHFLHINIGDLLRKRVQMDVDESACIRHAIKKGELVPPDIVANILKEEMLSNQSKVKGFLIDGFPREPSHGAAFERIIAPAISIIYLAANRDVLQKRLLINTKPEKAECRLDAYFKHKDAILEINHHKVIMINAAGPPDEITKATLGALERILANREELLAIDKRAGAVRRS